MDEGIFDIIILWAWAAWLFCANQIENNSSILILEWTESSAQKLLLSAKWRWNLTNKNINPSTDYATDDYSFVESAFKNYWATDFLNYLNNEWIETKEEDFWRILLASNKVSQFKEKLVKDTGNKWIQISYNTKVENVKKNNDIFEITTNNWIYKAKNLIISTWWPSFPSLWASPIAIKIAESFWLKTTPFYPALVWFETNQDFSPLSGSSVIWNLSLINNWKVIYEQTWPILFTHRWISGPCVFNASLFMREEWFYKVRINVERTEITKRLLAFLGFRENKLKSYQISTEIKKVRWLDEAKVCGWWIKTENLNQNFECKNISWLYFIWECLDVTWKTGWFNLQWCRTSWAICAKNFNKN